jgi:hypothetical protein
MRVSINVLRGNANAQVLCKAFYSGIKACGDAAVMRTEADHDMSDFSAAVLWGFTSPCQKVVEACMARGIPWIFIDMGYLCRDKYFKVALNDRHPTDYIMRKPMPNDRFERLGVPIKPWKMDNTGHILLAGMSGKAAWSFGMDAELFERSMIAELQKHTSRPIVYRPKPSWPNATPLKGATFNRFGSYEDVLNGAFCVVTHHSNVGCDALLAGIPVFTRLGAARPLALSHTDLELIETPHYPTEVQRTQWAANLAYCQWTAKEMASGECWQHFKGLMTPQ